MSLNSDIGCDLQFCHLSPGAMVITAIFVPLFTPWVAYMMVYRSRKPKFQSIRVLQILASLGRLFQFWENQTSLSWAISILFVTFCSSAFQWLKNTLDVAYATVSMGMPAPKWLGVFTRIGQALMLLTYPLLVLVFKAKGPPSCDLPSFLYDLTVIVFIYMIGLPLLGCHLQLRRVMRGQEKTMKEQEKRKSSIKKTGDVTVHRPANMSDVYKKARSKLNKLSVLMVLIMLFLTFSFVSQVSAQDTSNVCTEGSILAIDLLMNIFSIALAWHTNVQPSDPKQRTSPAWLERTKLYKMYFAFSKARAERKALKASGATPQKVTVVPGGAHKQQQQQQVHDKQSGTNVLRSSLASASDKAPLANSDGDLSPIHESRTYIEPYKPSGDGVHV